MSSGDKTARFEQTCLPHLDAAFNLARWLMRSPQDAEDAVQEAYLRAFAFFDGFHGGDGRAWLLSIVRNTCYTAMRRNRPATCGEPLEEDRHATDVPSPEAARIEADERERVRHAMRDLPAEFREAIVLREMEGLSYKEISFLTGVPIGTVMSRLARARKRLWHLLRPSSSGRVEA